MLADGRRLAGHYRALFDGSEYATGAYLYRLETPAGQQVRPMVLVK
jgi:hypothetical protein